MKDKQVPASRIMYMSQRQLIRSQSPVAVSSLMPQCLLVSSTVTVWGEKNIHLLHMIFCWVHEAVKVQGKEGSSSFKTAHIVCLHEKWAYGHCLLFNRLVKAFIREKCHVKRYKRYKNNIFLLTDQIKQKKLVFVNHDIWKEPCLQLHLRFYYSSPQTGK